MKRSTAFAVAGLLCAGDAVAVSGQSESEIFRRHEQSILKVEVVEALSGAPYVIGSAFVADSSGRLVTNYHVVNDIVFGADDYVLRLIDSDGVEHEAGIVRVDPVNDLAVLRADLDGAQPLELASAMPEVGDAVFSLGFPEDLSGTLVAGTFSGLLEQALGSRFHYSGSLSPGMSGGPTINEAGQVVGVNVATSGNQLSYLITAEAARRLMEEEAADRDLLTQARSSLIALQDQITDRFWADATEGHDLEPFQVATFADDAADCSAAPLQPDGYDFTGVTHTCAPADAVWLDPDDSVVPATLRHVLVVAEGMSRVRFAGLYTEWLQNVWDWEAPESRWVSEYRCARRNVTNEAGVKLRVAQCWRRREGLPGLYDLVAKVAVLGVSDRGLVTTMSLAGTTPENGSDFVTHLVQSVRWTR